MHAYTHTHTHTHTRKVQCEHSNVVNHRIYALKSGRQRVGPGVRIKHHSDQVTEACRVRQQFLLNRAFRSQ